jgi:transcriptional regulator with XRE-family HTH domain
MPDPVGVRVARARKQRGLTQNGLAQRTSYSRSHIAQVEAGHKVATPAFVAAVAGALSVDPADLYGQPYPGLTRAENAAHVAIAELRRAMVYAEVGPDLDVPPRSLDELADAIGQALQLRHRARHLQLAERLPGLIEELSWHTHETGDARAWTLLTIACNQLAGSLTRRLGYNDLSGLIMERAAASATHTQDPHLPLMVTFRRALLMMGVAAYGPAERLMNRSISAADPSRADGAEVLGSLHLRSAVVCARARYATRSWDHYQQAVEVSERAGRPSLDRHGSDFNPGNLAIHGAAIALELGDLDEAARRDEQIPSHLLDTLAAERRAHHEIDMSRVHLETGGYDKAMRRILRAEQTAPQMTRFHPSARTVVTHLVDVRRTVPEPLRGLRARMGV